MLSRTSKRRLPSLATVLNTDALIDIHLEVPEALYARKLVARESTTTTHGMPYLANLETANSVERTFRILGSTPATIELVGGTQEQTYEM